MTEQIVNNFCIVGEVPLKCKEPKFDEFEDETSLIVLLLHYFKTYLPEVMAKRVDSKNRQIKMNPADIDLTTHKYPGDFIAILVPTEDNSSYRDDGFMFEDTEYVFEFLLEVKADDFEGSMWNLVKLKSGIKTMLVNMDYNIGLNLIVDNFSHGGTGTIAETKQFVRGGTYRFSITDNRIKKHG